ncbi:MAG: pyridoxal-dependent decarboxylase [Deinococcales bacterium]
MSDVDIEILERSSPSQITPEVFRHYGYALIDFIADYRSQIAPNVRSNAIPGSLLKQLPDKAPENPESFDALLNDLNQLIMPHMTHWQHKDHYAYFPANSLLASVLADIVSSGLGVIGLNWQSAPPLTELELKMLDWMRQAFGLSETWQGVIQDTASTSTLVALLSAREKTTNHAQQHEGLRALPPQTVYSSQESHSSVHKAALLAGFGHDYVRSLGTNADLSLDVEALETTIQADIAQGYQPSAIVATLGTTTSTAFDDLKAIGAIAKRYGIWLHVDAAMAGAAMILPECQELWQGIELADSLVINAHKWFGVGFDCSLYYVKDSQHLIQVMSTSPSYLKTSADGAALNYRDWGIPLGRRFRALKLWFVLRLEGLEGIRARLRRDMLNARWLAKEISQEAHWQILAPVRLQTLCIRHEPPQIPTEKLDAYTLNWCERLNASGKAHLTPAKLKDSWMVRISIGAEMTTRADLAALWEHLQAVTLESISNFT